MANSKVQTYIFFDLETTGIPANKAKITELSFVAVLRSDLERHKKSNTLPPISKLSLLFNPEKNIQPGAVKITGLNNDLLRNQPLFRDEIDCINVFLKKPKPVCLVAHNGDRYDFKILKMEYLEAKRDLPDGLLCVDSLSVFREIIKPETLKYDAKQNITNSIENSSKSDQDESWPDLSIEEIDEIDELITKFSVLTSTPKASPKNRKVEKEMTKKSLNNTEKFSYKLGSIYERLLNKEITNAHHAEADCIALLECVVATKHDFLSCADKKQKSLSVIKI